VTDVKSRLHHVALLSTDPERSADLMRNLLDARVKDGSGAGKGPKEVFAFLPGIALVFVKADVPGPRTDAHLALSVSAEELTSCAAKLTQFGLEYQAPRQGGRDKALYFLDYDGNLFELNAEPVPDSET
jgi:catechol 2,3-dioxygenase-like lactoylglutathione lyase family enzyme